jgi:hypothetical protein
VRRGKERTARGTTKYQLAPTVREEERLVRVTGLMSLYDEIIGGTQMVVEVRA